MGRQGETFIMEVLSTTHFSAAQFWEMKWVFLEMAIYKRGGKGFEGEIIGQGSKLSLFLIKSQLKVKESTSIDN